MHIWNLVLDNMLASVIFLFCGLTHTYGLENVALNKTATQIDTVVTVDGEYDAINAIDGDTAGDYTIFGSMTHTMTQDGAWWKVDLEDIYLIDSIRIWNRNDAPKWRLANVQVFIALSDVESDYVLNGFHAGEIPGFYTFPMTGVYGRMVKITRSTPGLEYLTLCEVEVFGDEINQDVFDYIPGATGTAAILETKVTRSSVQCCTICLKTPKCAAVNYDSLSRKCDLLESTSTVINPLWGNKRFYKYPNL